MKMLERRKDFNDSEDEENSSDGGVKEQARVMDEFEKQTMVSLRR